MTTTRDQGVGTGIQAPEESDRNSEGTPPVEWSQYLRDLEHYMRGLSRAEATITMTHNSLRRFFRWLHACGLSPLTVTMVDVEAYRTALVDRSTHAVSTVNSHLCAVKRLYGHLFRTGVIAEDPSADVRLPKPRNRLPRDILTLAEMHRLLDPSPPREPRALRTRTALELLYSTALRLSELCNLTLRDVDVSNRSVRVNLGKGSKDRVVPMGRQAAQMVRAYLETARARLLGNQKDEGWLFPGRNGRHLGKATMGLSIRRAGQAAGISRRVTPHVLRHTCATHMMQAGASVLHIQQLLGHTDSSTTQIYMRVTCTDMRRALRRHHPREMDERHLRRLNRALRKGILHATG